jgi:hypothetical protein
LHAATTSGLTNLVLTWCLVNTNILAALQRLAPLPTLNRMREPMTRKTLSLPDSLWTAIEAYRATALIGSEVEAVRRLLLVALKNEGFPPIPATETGK